MSVVIITLGNGAEAAITNNGYLVIQAGITSVNLGKASRQQIERIQECLERLKVHCE